ncbi:MAG: hypothetical protein M3438_06470 [Pseudomonadota bacterium]|jgi:hypothetical protein|nr:hypothetical protein [Sphingomonas sp.]MDQ3478784.1 hypothetical protein [Pseudomonadota bacterium]
MGVRLSLLTTAGAVLALALAGASSPSVLSQISGGLWEISGQRGAPPTRLCIPQPPLLAQVEHRSAKCTQTVLRNDPASALIEYSCPGGGFGHSKITMLTPRSVRIETQGIADYAPFGYVVKARRIGNCPNH